MTSLKSTISLLPFAPAFHKISYRIRPATLQLEVARKLLLPPQRRISLPSLLFSLPISLALG